MAVKRAWVFGSNDLGDYLECEKCNHKLSAKQVIFGKYDINTCPFCGSEMNLQQKDYDRLKESLAAGGGEFSG